MELVLPAFLAGVISFLAPCTLPLVPAYLSFISGTSAGEIGKGTTGVRSKVFGNGLAFIIGFSLVFIIFGILAGLAGAALAPARIWITRLSGILVIFFGLFFLGVFKIPFLYQEKKLPLSKFIRPGHPLSSFLVGAGFATGWTPCVGPILGSVLLLVASTATVAQGTLALVSFSAGLAVPFLIVAATVGEAFAVISSLQKVLRVIEIVGGILIVLLGLLLLTDNWSLLVSYGYNLLKFFNYQEITKLL
jgi:cytochrome c-type biogenesis protein